MSHTADWTLAWKPLIDRIGTDLDGPGARFGPDAVELGAIRHWLEPLEFDCALHRDADAARAQGFPDVIAPYTAVWSFILPPVWQPGDPPALPDPARDAQPARGATGDVLIPGAPPTAAMFGTGISMEFLRPLHLGERVGAGPRRLVGCVPKQTRVGRGAFITYDRHIVTGDLEPVCRVVAEVYAYNPHDEGGSQDRRKCAPLVGRERSQPHKRCALVPGFPGRSRRFADVAVGDRLPTPTFPLPVYRLVMAAAGTRDFTGIHHNDSYARSVGAPSMYANAGLLMGMWERALRDYIGEAGTIRAIRDFRMVRFTTVGSVARVEGRVVGKQRRDGVPIVVIELRTVVDDVVTVGPGTAEVTLPE